MSDDLEYDLEYELKDAILEGGRNMTYRRTETHDWDAYYGDVECAYADRDKYKYDEPKVIIRQVAPNGEEGDYETFLGALNYSTESGVDIEGIGVAHLVEEFGGEGQGEQYWYVFSIEPKLSLNDARYFKVDGHYASYSGGYYDELFEVFPKQVTKTEWSQ